MAAPWSNPNVYPLPPPPACPSHKDIATAWQRVSSNGNGNSGRYFHSCTAFDSVSNRPCATYRWADHVYPQLFPPPVPAGPACRPPVEIIPAPAQPIPLAPAHLNPLVESQETPPTDDLFPLRQGGGRRCMHEDCETLRNVNGGCILELCAPHCRKEQVRLQCTCPVHPLPSIAQRPSQANPIQRAQHNPNIQPTPAPANHPTPLPLPRMSSQMPAIYQLRMEEKETQRAVQVARDRQTKEATERISMQVTVVGWPRERNGNYIKLVFQDVEHFPLFSCDQPTLSKLGFQSDKALVELFDFSDRDWAHIVVGEHVHHISSSVRWVLVRSAGQDDCDRVDEFIKTAMLGGKNDAQHLRYQLAAIRAEQRRLAKPLSTASSSSTSSVSLPSESRASSAKPSSQSSSSSSNSRDPSTKPSSPQPPPLPVPSDHFFSDSDHSPDDLPTLDELLIQQSKRRQKKTMAVRTATVARHKKHPRTSDLPPRSLQTTTTARPHKRHRTRTQTVIVISDDEPVNNANDDNDNDSLFEPVDATTDDEFDTDDLRVWPGSFPVVDVLRVLKECDRVREPGRVFGKVKDQFERLTGCRFVKSTYYDNRTRWLNLTEVDRVWMKSHLQSTWSEFLGHSSGNLGKPRGKKASRVLKKHT